MFPLKLDQAVRSLYNQQLRVLSQEDKISLKNQIHIHKIKSLPVIFFSMLMAIGALFAFCIGAMLAVIGDAVFLYEIFLPFILPGILLLLPIALLLHFAWKEQQCVSQKQQQIAESCYFETLTFCKAFQSREIFVRNLVKFIQQEVLPEGFAKRFIFAILTQAKPSLLAKKISLTKTSFDETIEKAFSHIQEGLYLSGQEKIDHENKLKE